MSDLRIQEETNKKVSLCYQPDSSINQLPSKQFMTNAKKVIAANLKINGDHKIKHSFYKAICFFQKQLPAFSLILFSTAAKQVPCNSTKCNGNIQD